MPITGGAVAKFGDRYEGRWTVLQAIRVLRGDCGGISLEEIGEAGEGVEFRLDHQEPHEPDEVHQVKRQRSEGDWTVAALKSAGVLEAFRKHLTASSATCVFVSSTSTRSLARLADDASRVRRLEAFEATLSQDADKEYQALRVAWGSDASFTHAALARCQVRTIDEESLVHQVVELLAFHVEGDPRNALDILAAYLVDRVHQRVTASELWQHLRSRGHPRRPIGPDPALSETVREVTERFTVHVERSRPASLPLLARDEVAQIVADLTSPDGPATVAVTGEAGAGKSSVLAAVVDALQARGVMVGAVRTDTLDPARTADELGRDAGYPGPPARITALAAAGRPAVLVVDQLDAVSLTGGRDQRLVDALEEVFAQARATADLRLLVACRSFDLTHDRRLRQLLTRGAGSADHAGDERWDIREVVVGALSDAQLDEALTTLGVARSDVPGGLRQLLRNAFNLGLFAPLVAEGGFTDYASLRTRFDLLRQFEKVKRDAVRRRGLSDTYVPAVRQLAAHLSAHGRLWGPEGVLGEFADTRDALLSEGVLVREAQRLRFFHDAYFDYVFADAHVSGGGSARSLLEGDPQDLFRRAQVRSILAYERDLDPSAYLADLANLLFPGRVRAQIRAVVLDGLGAQRPVLDGEFTLVETIVVNLNDSMRSRALPVLVSGGWPAACQQRGFFRQYVAELEKRALASSRPSPRSSPSGRSSLAAPAGLARWTTDELLYQLVFSAKELPEEVAAACRPLAEYPGYAYALLRLVNVATSSHGTACTELLQELIAAADPDRGPQGLVVFEDDFWYALRTIVETQPELAAAVVHRWLERGGRISADRGGAHPFDHETTVLPERPSGLHILADLAVRAPEAVLEELLPWLVGEVGRARVQPTTASQPRPDALRNDRIFWLHTEEGLRFEDEILHAVRDALAHLAAARPTRATPFLATCASSDLQTLQLLAASAYAAADPSLMDDALTWAAQPRVRGLPRGATHAWATREVLARAAAVGSPAQQAEAVRLILDPYRDLAIDNNVAAAWDDNERLRAAEQLVVADGVAAALADRCPEELADRLRQLVAILGPAPTTWQDTITVRFVGSPVPDEEARAFSDDEWLQAAARYSGEDTPLRPDGTFAGDALQLAHILEEVVHAEPARFAALLGRLGPTAHPAYASAILQGLRGTDASPITAAVREVSTWPNRPHGAEICDALASVAHADLYDDLIGVVAWHAQHDPDPEAEVWQQLAPSGEPYYGGDPNFAALNCVRGRAVLAIAGLLRSTQYRLRRLAMFRDTVAAVVDDPVEQVRVMLPAALAEVWKADGPVAAKLLRAWAGRASEIGWTAGELPRLLVLVDLTDPGLAAELLARMLHSHHAPVRHTAGSLVVFLLLRAAQRTDTQPVPQPADRRSPRDNLLNLALADASARAGMADSLAGLLDELVDDLHESPTPATAGSSPTKATAVGAETTGDVVAPGLRLLVRLLDDDDPAVRSAAMQFGQSLRRPLVEYSTLLTTVTRTQGFADDPQTLLYALRQRPGELPDAVLDLCDRFLDQHGAEAADIQTRASASAGAVIELVLALHAQSRVGSALRSRSLDLLDRLVILRVDTIHTSLAAYER